MFGDKVTVNLYGSNVLDAKFVNIENPEEFMNERGYDKVLKQTVEEKSYTDVSFDGGAFDPVKIETEIPVSRTLIKSAISYMKENTYSKDKVIERSSKDKQEFTNSLKLNTIVYRQVTPFSQKNKPTTTSNTAFDNLIKTGAEKGGNLFSRLLKMRK